jgi:hypothetical protein
MRLMEGMSSADLEIVGDPHNVQSSCKDLVKAQSSCPACHTMFSPQRSNQLYCCKGCQKNGSRGSRRINDSPEEKRRTHEHYNRAYWLAGELYSMQIDQRLGFMAKLIENAMNDDASLRNILTDPKLLKPSKDHKFHYWRKCPGSYDTIAQSANKYCRKFWGASVRQVVRGECPTPPTGEVC